MKLICINIFLHVSMFVLEDDEGAGTVVDEDGFQQVKLTKKQRWKKQKMIRDQLASTDIMSSNEVERLIIKIRGGKYDVTSDLALPDR